MRDLKGKPRYIESHLGYRTGHGVIDYMEGLFVVDSILAEIKPSRYTSEIADSLNIALDHGYAWASMRAKECRLFKSNKEFEACLKRVKLL